MAKYGKLSQQVAPPPRPWQVHPIWRGIGCLFVLIGPVVAYAAADLLVRSNMDAGWVPTPPELMRTIRIPVLDIAIEHALANLLLTVILLLIGFSIIMVVYAIVYSILGPPRYGPLDSPPIRDSTPRRRR
jgi:hypothetical protein